MLVRRACNEVTDDIKVMVKTNRLVGVHVTPTVMFNVSGVLVTLRLRVSREC